MCTVSSGGYPLTVVGGGGTNHKPMTGCWASKAHRCARTTKDIRSGNKCLGQTDRRSIVAQVTENVHDGYGRKRKHNELHPAVCGATQPQIGQSAEALTIGTRSVVHFGHVHVRHLPGEVMASGCTVGRR